MCLFEFLFTCVHLRVWVRLSPFVRLRLLYRAFVVFSFLFVLLVFIAVAVFVCSFFFFFHLRFPLSSMVVFRLSFAAFQLLLLRATSAGSVCAVKELMVPATWRIPGAEAPLIPGPTNLTNDSTDKRVFRHTAASFDVLVLGVCACTVWVLRWEWSRSRPQQRYRKSALLMLTVLQLQVQFVWFTFAARYRSHSPLFLFLTRNFLLISLTSTSICQSRPFVSSSHSAAIFFCSPIAEVVLMTRGTLADVFSPASSMCHML